MKVLWSGGVGRCSGVDGVGWWWGGDKGVQRRPRDCKVEDRTIGGGRGSQVVVGWTIECLG